MSYSRNAESQVKESLEQIYNELNRLGYELIDYTNSLSDISYIEPDIGNKVEQEAIKKTQEPLPDIQKIVDGFKQLEGMSIDLLSPYGDIDFEFENRTCQQEGTQDIIKRYNEVVGGKETPYPRTPQELIARYQKLNRG